MDLAVENAKLRDRIEDLEFRLAEIIGSKKGNEKIDRIRAAFKIQPKPAMLAFFLMDGERKTLAQCQYAIDVEELHGNNVAKHLTDLRRAGLIIENVWGRGWKMDKSSCDRLNDLLGEARN